MLQKDPLTIHWGLEEEANLFLKSTSTGAVVQIGDREFVGITQQSLARFEPSIISNYLPFQLSALVSIREQQILVGVTAISSEFVVILLSDIKNPVFPKIKTNDTSIFNMIYLPKSSLLITSGEDLKVWRFDYYHNSKSIIPTEPRLNIEYQRTIISKYQGSILNPPIVDFSTEIIYIDDNNGSLQKYKATTGENVGCAFKYHGTSKTSIAYNPTSKKFLFSNAEQGTVLYHKSGSFSNRFILSNTAILAIRFINKEYAILLDANHGITILDVKTSRSFLCYKGEKPIKRLFLFEQPIPRLILCFNNNILIFRIVLPWKYFTTTISSPLSMLRCSKINEAARLLVLCSNSHIKLISPSMKATLTAVTLSSLSSPILSGFYYDRGTEKVKRDQLMLPLKNGEIQIFSTGENPCRLISTVEAKTTCICLCKYKNKDCFVFGTSAGNLLFYDYETLKNVHRVVLVPFSIIKIYYFESYDDDENDSLCLVFNDRLLRYSLKNEKIYEDVRINGSEVSISFNDVVLFGYENGEIGSAYFDTSDENCRLVEHYTNGMKIHDDKITGFSLGLDSDFFVSCSFDMSIRIWTTKEMTLIKEVVYPIKLFSVAVLNGKRDIVVGTDSEIMFVDGRLAFKQKVDEENIELDNYDKKLDFLSSQFSLLEKEKEETESSFLSNRKNSSEINESEKRKKPINNKIKRFTEALKKHEQMMNDQLNEFSNNEQQNKQQSKKAPIDDDERERLFNQMNEITNGKPKKPIPKIENQPKTKKPNIKEYEYEYEYENEEETETETETETENLNSNQHQENEIEINKNQADLSLNSETSNIKNDFNENNENDFDMKIKMPSSKNGLRSPKRNLRRALNRYSTTSSIERPNTNLNDDESENSYNESDNESDSEVGNNETKHKNNKKYLLNSGENDDQKSKSRKKTSNHRKSHIHESEKHHHSNLNSNSHNGHEIDDENENEINGKSIKRKHNKNNNSSNNHNNYNNSKHINNNTKSSENEKRMNAVNDNLLSNSSSQIKNKGPNRNTKSFTNHEPSTETRKTNSIDRRTRLNLLLVNSAINDSKNETASSASNKNDRILRSNSSLVKSSTPQNQTQNQFQVHPMKMKPTRRYPTPLGYHFVHPGLSLFEKSLKPRRPRTPDKSNNGLIISRSIVPTNIILDASALDNIIESDDDRYRPLINQIRPLLRSHYNYYNEKMRNMNRIHAYFDLNIMIPAYKRNRQQIEKHIQELRKVTKNKDDEKSLKKSNLNESFIVPPISIDDFGGNNLCSKSCSTFVDNGCKKHRRLIDVGKIRHSYEPREKMVKNRSIFSPRIIKPKNKEINRKASCPPRINQKVILAPLPQTTRKMKNEKNLMNESDEYNMFLKSLCSGRKDRKVVHEKQKSLFDDLPSGSLYVTGQKLMIDDQKSPKNQKNQQSQIKEDENEK